MLIGVQNCSMLWLSVVIEDALHVEHVATLPGETEHVAALPGEIQHVTTLPGDIRGSACLTVNSHLVYLRHRVCVFICATVYTCVCVWLCSLRVDGGKSRHTLSLWLCVLWLCSLWVDGGKSRHTLSLWRRRQTSHCRSSASSHSVQGRH